MFAQIPSSTAAELGAWLVAFAAFVGIIVLVLTGVNQWRLMTAPPPPPPPPPPPTPIGLRLVTHDEHKEAQKNILERLDKHEDYTRGRLHELSNSMHSVGLRVAAQPAELRQMMDTAIAPLGRKIDTIATAVAALTALAAKNEIAPNRGDDDQA